MSLGNKIIGAGDQGIDFVAVNGSVISRNDISKVTGVAALFAKGGSTNVRIEYNKIHDVAVDGITIGGWTTVNWMRPGMRDYEAKNVVAIGNEIYDVGKRPLSFLGARDSTATGNLLERQSRLLHRRQRFGRQYQRQGHGIVRHHHQQQHDQPVQRLADGGERSGQGTCGQRQPVRRGLERQGGCCRRQVRLRRAAGNRHRDGRLAT